ncbi:MAG TPA: hypothetical protein VFH82_04715 [Gemmatimonadota bacterium]|nr:hypothetical protein [Gemmatimonadota bacterium]
MATSASAEEVWAALPEALREACERPWARRYARFLECRDQGSEREFDAAVDETLAGFRVASADPPRRLSLEGRHRFSRYQLTFEIEPQGSFSRVRAVTQAEFPGLRGGLYRAAVVGSGGHRIITRRILKSIARRAERIHSRRKEGE